MQINNSIANGQLSTHVKASTSVDRQQLDARVKSDENLAGSNQVPKKNIERFDVDERALEVISQQKTFKEQPKSTSYDQPTQQNSTAVSAYQSIDNLATRDKVQQTFGVDLFA